MSDTLSDETFHPVITVTNTCNSCGYIASHAVKKGEMTISDDTLIVIFPCAVCKNTIYQRYRFT